MTGYERWVAAAGEDFDATSTDDSRFRLRLADVGDARHANGWLAYTLRFTGTDIPAEQQTYELTGAGITEPVFLVPVAHSGDGLTLEAVFTVPDDEEKR